MSLATTGTAHAPVLSLPNELLATVFDIVVFEAALSSSHDHFESLTVFQIAGGLPSQLVLMSVCNSWKFVCMSFPAIWSRICIALVPATRTPIDPTVWQQFADACGKALQCGGRSSPLDLKLHLWNVSDESIQSVADTPLQSQVFDSTWASYRILRFCIEHSPRWRTFVMQGHDHMHHEDEPLAGIPWSQLVDIRNRIPNLQAISLIDLDEKPPPASPLRSYYANIFREAPKLSEATFNSRVFPLNLPWSQLTKITINYTGFDSYKQFADYFVFVMRNTTASTFSWGDDSLALIEDVDNILPTLETVENPHITDFRIPPMILPPVLLPNLTSLLFVISDARDVRLDSVSQVLSLLKDSGCRLLHLTVEQWTEDYTADAEAIVLLLPYLTNLQSLTWTAALADEEFSRAHLSHVQPP
ncbi:hypothetical protein CYLTODRAFT_473452 [Cylindrobasidium torrendii FP15055 ss-10]|uniref:F-box domain-containing protein n=1 Tax=Cylindrobasidium torrendii FP15055 ss-10 TaxID=1314674 RepID=A0A0D7AY20_9AGAR|nr:hypothetical protein CYLTODRAFT_473452 [Cylindrobasidium torrendii FP15055 ss-10]